MDQQINGEPTNREILDSINTYATKIEGDIAKVATNIANVALDVKNLSFKMVTKDYFDDHLVDLEMDLKGLVKKEDQKVDKFIDIVHEKQVLTDSDVTDLHRFDPFPKPA